MSNLTTSPVIPATVEDDERLYTTGRVGVATFFGGPLAAAYLVARNFRVLEQPDAARRVLFGSVAALAVALCVVALLPDWIADARWFQTGVASAWAALAAVLVEAYQGDAISAHLEAGGRKGSWLTALGAMVGGLAVTLLLGILIFSVAPPFDGKRHDIDGAAGAVYYSGTTTESNARMVGLVLRRVGFFAEGAPEIALGLVGDADGLELQLLMDPRLDWEDPTLVGEIEMVANQIERATQRPTRISFAADGFGGRRVQVIRERSLDP